jgi:serine/threonine protein kinase/Flp pilus assembly protein TadD
MRNFAKSVEAPPLSGTRDAGASGWSVRRLVSEIKSQWLRGEPADARAVLTRHPELGSDKSAVLDLAYEEYCLRRQAGTSPDPDEFCQRFPHYRTSLRRLIEAHHCVEAAELAAQDSEVSWPEVGDSFLGFVLRRELGRGAFARVFLASEPELGNRSVVVKISRHGAVEAELLGRLKDIANVVEVHTLKKDELSGWTAVCMPYVGSATLCDVMDYVFAQPEPPRDARRILEAVNHFCLADEPAPQSAPHRLLRQGTYVDGVLYLAVQLAEGLSCVHARGICHGDLKPSNILLTPDGKPLLVDFNLSFDPRQSGQRLGGTLPYMSPEQLQPGAWERGRTPLDVRSDLFAFGVILYELLTGQHPFGPIRGHASWTAMRAELVERQRRGARPLRDFNPRVPRQLARVVEQSLAFAPEDRPRSLDQVGSLLRKDLKRPQAIARQIIRDPRIVLPCILLLVGGFGVRSGAGLWREYRYRQFVEQAQTALHGEDYTKAIEYLSQVIETDPGNAAAWYLRGKAHRRAGAKVTEAIEDVMQADRLRPSKELKAYLGYLLNLGQKSRRAIDYYQHAIQAGFGSAGLYNNLGYSYLVTGDFPAAGQWLSRAIQTGAPIQAAYYNRALMGLMGASDQPEDVPRALLAIEKAIQIGPVTAQLCRHAASLYAVAAESDPKFREPALVYLRKAIELGEDPQELNEDAYLIGLRDAAAFQELLHLAHPPKPLPENLQVVDPLQGMDFLP